MATSQTSEIQPGKKVRVRVPSGGMRLVSKALFLRVLAELVAGLGATLQVDGAQAASETADGAALKLLPGGGTAAHPFKGERRNGVLWIRGGFVNALELDDEEIDAVSTGHAWCRVEFDLSVEFDFVFTAQLLSATLDHGPELPADDGRLGIFHVLLFSFTNGQVTSQSVTQHLVVRACDDGSGSGTAALSVIQS